MSKISEKTWVSLGLVITLLGGVVWLTTIWMQSEANARSIQKIEEKQTTIDLIQTDIAVIKTKLEGIE